ncbi:MAG: winged helix-turn-helix transcriptional regulator [Candidatus Micrarchaeota archaeon]
MVSNKRTAFAILLIAVFALLIFLTVFSFQTPENSALSVLYHLLFGFHVELMVLLSMVGVVVGAVVFYLLSDKVDKKGLEARAVAELVLKFMDRDEKLVISELLRGNGRIMQAEISRLEGMTRLKAHRIVAKLESMGVIDVQKSGKLKIIHLKEELKKALLEK